MIEVYGTGAGACGFSSSPGVGLGSGAGRDRSESPGPVLAGGAARFTVRAGQRACAVIGLDCSGAITGTVQGVNEINVLVDQDGVSVPLAGIRSFPLPGGVRVLGPWMGLYRAGVAEAAACAATAGK
ncbi:putative protein OS=Kitasatospora aureofaciens OX=1894 GN=HS99_0017145 PE=4 SV=1 [Kitasatospora aureofaciens]